jgi:hypothetical protein
MSVFFQVSAQYGDSRASHLFFPVQRRLNQAFGEEMDRALIGNLEKLSVVLRVSGAARDFNHVGPERLKYLRKDREITIDLAISENEWKGVSADKVKASLRTGLETCVRMLLDRAHEEGCLLDRPKVERLFTSKFDSVFQPIQ